MWMFCSHMGEDNPEEVYVLFNEVDGIITDLFDNPDAAQTASDVTGDTVFGPYQINSDASHFE